MQQWSPSGFKGRDGRLYSPPWVVSWSSTPWAAFAAPGFRADVADGRLMDPADVELEPGQESRVPICDAELRRSRPRDARYRLEGLTRIGSTPASGAPPTTPTCRPVNTLPRHGLQRRPAVQRESRGGEPVLCRAFRGAHVLRAVCAAGLLWPSPCGWGVPRCGPAPRVGGVIAQRTQQLDANQSRIAGEVDELTGWPIAAASTRRWWGRCMRTPSHCRRSHRRR